MSALIHYSPLRDEASSRKLDINSKYNTMDLMNSYDDSSEDYAYNALSLNVPFESATPFNLLSQTGAWASQRVGNLGDDLDFPQYEYGHVPPLSAVPNVLDPSVSNEQSSVKHFLCTHPGCNISFKRKGDCIRHEKAQHNPGGPQHICGCCKEPITFRRRDKVIKHMKHVHNFTGKHGVLLKECPWKDCHQSLKVWFPSEDALSDHLSSRHGNQQPSEQSPATSVSTCGDMGILNASSCPASAKNESPTSPPGTSSQTSNYGIKRPQPQEAKVVTKRLKGGVPQLGEKVFPLELVQILSCSFDFEGELVIPNIRPADFLTLCKIDALRAVESYFGAQSITLMFYDVSRELIKMRGSTRKIQLVRWLLEYLLQDKQCLKLPRTRFNIPMKQHTTKSDLDHRPRVWPPIKTPSHCTTWPKLFPLRKDEDKELFTLWHEYVLPFLLSLLAETIGSNYSASLVRQGTSEHSSHPTIRIQCPRKPPRDIRQHIRSQIYNTYPALSTQSKIRVQFLAGSLVLLANDDESDASDDEGEDEELNYPLDQLYWPRPGMGASIGHGDTDSASLCAWLRIDGRPLALVAGHFIGDPNRNNHELIVMSPAKADRLETIGILEEFETTLPLLIRKEMEKIGKDQVTLSDIDESSQLDLLKEQMDQVTEDLGNLRQDDDKYKFALVERVGNFDDRPPVVPNQWVHSVHLDWALLKPLQERSIGVNRPRFRYDENGYIRRFDGDTEEFGAGDLCQIIGTLEIGAKVYFYGKTTGRQEGTVYCTYRAATRSTEYAIVVNTNQRKDDKSYIGLSGAPVIDMSNHLVAMVWGALGGLILITPMKDIAEDIKETLAAREVVLCSAKRDPTLLFRDMPVCLPDLTLTNRTQQTNRRRPSRRTLNLKSIQVRSMAPKSYQESGCSESVIANDNATTGDGLNDTFRHLSGLIVRGQEGCHGVTRELPGIGVAPSVEGRVEC